MTRAASYTSPRAVRPGGARPSPREGAWAMSCAALGRTAVPGLTRNLLPHAAGVLS